MLIKYYNAVTALAKDGTRLHSRTIATMVQADENTVLGR